MPLDFDPGYIRKPFQTLCDQAPDASIYPYSAFRTEWGPIFHQGSNRWLGARPLHRTGSGRA